MKFAYVIDGKDVVIDVFFYKPYCPMVITGSGFGDAEPPQQEEIEFSVLDSRGLPWPEMANKINAAEEAKILTYYKKLRGLKCQ